ncbi:hypothetical protein [Idiomarina abyssalis]|uniref:Lipoprotein n=1 Tax=Idiomarina abyssalis TaxID=86102 RepID=A0A8I1GBY0_9GAMM|nr:hypothetical protein [Idiomarina abyssalis]MBJ7265422.1 hypothetical protein [Idiomarina abyssalis]MBJ7316904.1 hypothetical protein [Idiomarina abyssalis]
MLIKTIQIVATALTLAACAGTPAGSLPNDPEQARKFVTEKLNSWVKTPVDSEAIGVKVCIKERESEANTISFDSNNFDTAICHAFSMHPGGSIENKRTYVYVESLTKNEDVNAKWAANESAIEGVTRIEHRIPSNYLSVSIIDVSFRRETLPDTDLNIDLPITRSCVSAIDAKSKRYGVVETRNCFIAYRNLPEKGQ